MSLVDVADKTIFRFSFTFRRYLATTHCFDKEAVDGSRNKLRVKTCAI